MSLAKHMAASLLYVLLVACHRAPEAAPVQQSLPNEIGTAVEPLPDVDKQSPDSVVRSHWALQDWARKNAIKDLRFDVGPTMNQYLDARISLSAGDFGAQTQKDANELREPLKGDDSSRVQQRDIMEVKSESETRAIVLAKIKNVTPIPPDFHLDEYNQKRRDFGQEVRYVVEKVKGEWRLTQAWYRDDEDDKEWTKSWDLKPPPPGPSPYDFSTVDR